MNIIKLFESVVDKKPDYTAIWLISLFPAKRFGVELMQKLMDFGKKKAK